MEGNHKIQIKYMIDYYNDNWIYGFCWLGILYYNFNLYQVKPYIYYYISIINYKNNRNIIDKYHYQQKF